LVAGNVSQLQHQDQPTPWAKRFDVTRIVDTSALGSLTAFRSIVTATREIEQVVGVLPADPSINISPELWNRFTAGLLEFELVGTLGTVTVGVNNIDFGGVTDVCGM
jgi:hypothetical protein